MQGESKTYGVEHAKSGQAHCRLCHDAIQDAALRWTFSEHMEGPYYFHLHCLNYPVDGLDFKDVRLADDVASDPEAVASARDALDEARRRRDAYEHQQEAKEERKLEHMDLTPRSPPDASASLEGVQQMFAQMPVDELKEYLRVNGYHVGGNKAHLVKACALGEKCGASTLCPKCKWGKLDLDVNVSTPDDPVLSCRGHYNNAYFEKCDFACQGEQARTLLQPWVTLHEYMRQHHAAAGEDAEVSGERPASAKRPVADDAKSSSHAAKKPKPESSSSQDTSSDKEPASPKKKKKKKKEDPVRTEPPMTRSRAKRA